MKYPVITFMLIGVIASMGIIIANNRGIIIDAVIADMGATVSAWELAFGVYILFFIGGIVVDMIIEKRKEFTVMEDYQRIILTLIVYIISIFMLQAVSQGVIGSTEFAQMQLEFYQWYGYFALAFIVYFSHIIISKR